MAPIPYWENLFPTRRSTASRRRRTWRRSSAAQPRLDHRALRRRPVLLPGVQPLRSLRVLHPAVRLAGGAELARAIRVQRDAADAPPPVHRRLPVRLELHAGPRQGPRLAGRARAAPSTTSASGGYSGFLVNSWEPDLQLLVLRLRRAAPDQRQLAGGAAVRPGQAAGAAAPGRLTNAIIGDWSVAGIGRWTSGFPFNVINCRSCWATNWNLQGNAALARAGRAARDRDDAQRGRRPAEPVRRSDGGAEAFRNLYPGEAGIRNLLRGDGYFTIDLSIGKGVQAAVDAAAGVPLGHLQPHQHPEVRHG